MLLSIFDSELIDTFNQLFEPSELYDLKEFLGLKTFVLIGALLGYLWFITSVIKLIGKSIKAFIKGLKS
mgnify:CR=1 FL=1